MEQRGFIIVFMGALVGGIAMIAGAIAAPGDHHAMAMLGGVLAGFGGVSLIMAARE